MTVARILERHGLPAAEPVPGYNPTHPTFVCGDAVVKLFGNEHFWRTERAALAAVADAGIGAPTVLAEGRDGDTAYLVMSRVSGRASEDDDLTEDQRVAMAVEVARRLRRLHALPHDGVPTVADWPLSGVTAGAERSSLPPHLVAQAEDFVAGVAPFDLVVTHSDLCGMHVFTDGGVVSGLIDWGDAMVNDRHYELIQVFRDLFSCDRALLKVFLDAYDWPAVTDFPRHALRLALHRQAIGLLQHRKIDVFMPIAERWPLADIATLDDLANELFSV